MVALSLESPPLPVAPEKEPLVKIRVKNDKVELPKPPPPKKVEPPPEPPKPPPPEKKAEKPKPKVEPKKKKRRALVKKKRKPQVAPKPSPVVAAPLVVSNVSLGGGIAVTQGDEDIFGDPEESRKGVKTAPSTPEPTPVGTAEEAPKRRPVVVSAKPSSSNPKQVPWPRELPRKREQFRVKLSLRINAKGRVAKISVISGKGEPFDSAAKAFAKTLRFSPATKDGVPIPSSVPWELCWNCAN